MKEKNKSLFWMLLAFFIAGLYTPVHAQDDLYYDPATDAAPAPAVTNNNDNTEYREPSNITRRYDQDDYYDEDDDYAYQYSSRIRRFHRPAPAIDYYDPFFVDLYYYDPYFLPGNSIYTYGYNDYWSWRRWNRAQRWNSWSSWGVGPIWSSWGWSSCYSGYNAWNNPWAFNNYYYDPYWTWNGYNPYYGNAWSNNDYYYNNNGGNNNNNGYQPKTYTGVRTHGSTVNPGYARIADNNGSLGRLAVQKDGPVLQTSRSNRSTSRDVVKDVEPARTTTNPMDRTRAAEESTSGRRPDDRMNAPTNTNGRNAEQPESTRPTREPAPRRNDAETRPPRTEKPTRTETPTRRSEPTTSPRNEERTRSNDRPSRTEERSRSNSTPARTQESSPTRTESSSPRSYDSGSSSRSSSGSNNSSSGSSKSNSGSSSGGGSRGRNN